MTKVSLYAKQHVNGAVKSEKSEKKLSQKDVIKKMERGKEITSQLYSYVQTPEVQSTLERMPKQDALFIREYDAQITPDGKLLMANPQLVYCKDYFVSDSSKKKNEIQSLEIEIKKGINKDTITSWLKKIIS